MNKKIFFDTIASLKEKIIKSNQLWNDPEIVEEKEFISAFFDGSKNKDSFALNIFCITFELQTKNIQFQVINSERNILEYEDPHQGYLKYLELNDWNQLVII